MPPIQNHLKTLSGLLLSLFLIGCERNTPEEMLNNYQYRVRNVLDVDQVEKVEIQIRPLFPLRRQLIMPTTEIREGLLDVMNLRECDLLPLIVERNSSLGKVYSPSQKMRYELMFYHALGKCKGSLESSSQQDKELMAQVNKIFQIKTQNLPAELWNGIFTAKEIELNFSRNKETLPLIDDGSVTTSINAIKALTGIIRAPLQEGAWKLPAQLDSLESTYEILYNNRSGPKILSSLQLMTAHLTLASEALDQGLNKTSLCFNGTPSANAKILNNVFYKYYIGEVQPYLAKVHKYAIEWNSANNDLIDALTEHHLNLPKSLVSYRRLVLSNSSPDSLWAQYISARNKHTQSWQKLLKQCGMMPTQSD